METFALVLMMIGAAWLAGSVVRFAEWLGGK